MTIVKMISVISSIK